MQALCFEADTDSDYGDYVDWESDEFCEVEVTAEPIDRYHYGCVYYPVRVGEVLDGRYRIVHKLGHGGFSTVWMAKDLQTDDLVALKILVSGKDGRMEFLAQGMMKQRMGSAPHILTYITTFEVSGRDGDPHHVLVMPLLGPSLGTRSYNRLFTKEPMTVRLSAARQLLIALKALHQAGLVHGDLNSGAVMWEMTGVGKCDTATQYRYFGRPQKLDIAEGTWRPGDLVAPMTIPPELVGDTIYLGDFGMAIPVGTPVNVKIQTPAVFCCCCCCSI